MKNKIKILGIIVIFYTLLTACNNQAVNNNASTQIYDPKIMETYIETLFKTSEKIEMELSSGVMVDANINIPDFSEINLLSTTRANFSKTKALELLFSDRNYYANPNDDDSFLADSNMSYLKVGSNLLSLAYIDGKKGADVSNLNSILYAVYEDDDLLTDERQYFYSFFENEDLSFKSIKSVDEEIRAIFSEFNINLSKNYEAYALSEEKYQELGITLPSHINTKDLEIPTYYFEYTQDFSGMSITKENHGDIDTGYYVNGTSIRVIYNENGIVEIFAEGLYDGENATKTLTVPMIDVNDVIDKIDVKYNEIIPRGIVTINEINFEYVAVPIDSTNTTFEIIPCFVVHLQDYFVVNERGFEEGVSVKSYIIYNAITGEEIL